MDIIDKKIKLEKDIEEMCSSFEKNVENLVTVFENDTDVCVNDEVIKLEIYQVEIDFEKTTMYRENKDIYSRGKKENV
jgi:hypothetical protein